MNSLWWKGLNSSVSYSKLHWTVVKTVFLLSGEFTDLLSTVPQHSVTKPPRPLWCLNTAYNERISVAQVNDLAHRLFHVNAGKQTVSVRCHAAASERADHLCQRLWVQADENLTFTAVDGSLQSGAGLLAKFEQALELNVIIDQSQLRSGTLSCAFHSLSIFNISARIIEGSFEMVLKINI